MVWGDIKPPVGKGELYEPIKRKKKMPSPRCLNTLVAHFFICEMIVLNSSYPWKHVSESRYALERINGNGIPAQVQRDSKALVDALLLSVMLSNE